MICVEQNGLLCDRKGERANVAPYTQEAALMRVNVASLHRRVTGKPHIEFVHYEGTLFHSGSAAGPSSRTGASRSARPSIA